MNRLQKKCFVASAGFHLLLVVILFVGSAFLSAPRHAENQQVLDFIPDRLVDSAARGGGAPQAAPPVRTPSVPVPPTSQPSPAPKVEETVTPPRENTKAPKQKKTEVDISENSKKQRLSADDLRPVNHKANTSKSQKKAATTASDDQERQFARQMSAMLSNTAKGIKEGTASSTKVDEPNGPGGGGPTYASFKDWLYTVYMNAWIAPENAASESATVEASIVIASDGTVVSSRITKKSGDPQVDASVQRALDRVTNIGKPFPEGVKDKQRPYTLQFDVKMKRGMA